MSNHNYSQYSNKKRDANTDKRNNNNRNNPNKPVTAPIVQEPKPVVNLVQETVETTKLPATVEGVVVNCGKLNVRVAPNINADIVCVLNSQSEIVINVAESTDEWFRICTASGMEGYCMRKYVDAYL